jgi:hypothetical protein
MTAALARFAANRIVSRQQLREDLRCRFTVVNSGVC